MSLAGAEFVKMHGLGNDFVMLDLRDAAAERVAAAEQPSFAAAIANRRRGVGCDQVILIEAAEAPEADGRLVFLNADGSRAGACGNGARCAAELMMASGAGADRALRLETESGVLAAERLADGQMRVNMGPASFDWRDVPLRSAAPTDDLIDALGPIDGAQPLKVGAASMGNPHCVLFVEDVAAIDVARVGATLERHPLFPERANIGFAEIRAADRMRLRVFERGAGLTEACGSGACAALAIGARLGLCGDAATIELDGGALDVAQDPASGAILMTGPTARVYAGRLDPEIAAAIGA